MIAALNRSTRILALFVAGIVLAAASTHSATAASRLCQQLETELASAARPSAAQIRRYDTAIDKQRGQIRKARNRWHGAGCGRVLFRNSRAECGALNARLERMERNLEALQRKRREITGENSGQARARIAASLRANGCREESNTVNAEPRGVDRNADLLGRIIGGIEERSMRRGIDDDLDDRHVRRLPGPLEETGGGRSVFVPLPAPDRQFRTFCVRTCDGYYFPKSPASSSADFSSEQKGCEASCPGTAVRLYHHRAVGEQPADMVSSISGAPYSELPTAYLYRKPGAKRPPGCSCSAPKNFKVIAGNPPARTSIVEAPGAPANPDAGPAPQAPATPGEAGNRKVRVVGPAFLPDPAEAIDLRAPARR
jgi:hypothetical protein